MSHSFYKIWNRNRVKPAEQPPAKTKAGAPEWHFTRSRERKLFRLIVDANLKWDHIAAAMYEDATESADGKEWAPGKSTCRNHFYKITEMDPRDMRITDTFRRKRKREQLIQAFNLYNKRMMEQELAAESPTKTVPGTSSAEHINDGDDHTIRGFKVNDLAGNTPQNPPPSLLPSEASTPAGSDNFAATPVYRFPNGPNIQQEPSLVHVAEEVTEFEDIGPVVPKQNSEYDEICNCKASINDHDTSCPLANIVGEVGKAMPLMEMTSATVSAIHTPDLKFDMVPDALITHQARVPEEETMSVTGKPPRVTKKSKKAEQMTVEQVEDAENLPHGFINHVKYRMSASRSSIYSMISSGTIRSRFSARRTSWRKSGDGSNTQHRNHMSVASSVFQFTSLTPPLNAQEEGEQRHSNDHGDTNLIDVLQSGDASDIVIAERLIERLAACDRNGAEILMRSRNHTGKHALEVAVELGNVPACVVLLDFGTDVYAKSSQGENLAAMAKRIHREAKDNIHLYYAVGACKNHILDHNPKAKKRNEKWNKMRSKKRRNGDIGELAADSVITAPNKFPRISQRNGGTHLPTDGISHGPISAPTLPVNFFSNITPSVFRMPSQPGDFPTQLLSSQIEHIGLQSTSDFQTAGEPPHPIQINVPSMAPHQRSSSAISFNSPMYQFAAPGDMASTSFNWSQFSGQQSIDPTPASSVISTNLDMATRGELPPGEWTTLDNGRRAYVLFGLPQSDLQQSYDPSISHQQPSHSSYSQQAAPSFGQQYSPANSHAGMFPQGYRFTPSMNSGSSISGFHANPFEFQPLSSSTSYMYPSQAIQTLPSHVHQRHSPQAGSQHSVMRSMHDLEPPRRPRHRNPNEGLRYVSRRDMHPSG